jgi:hypothetical protein
MINPLTAFRVLLADFGAWRRGLRRVAPRFGPSGTPTRGRIYAAAEPAPARAKSEPIVTITARHFGPDGALKGTHVVRGRAGKEN